MTSSTRRSHSRQCTGSAARSELRAARHGGGRGDRQLGGAQRAEIRGPLGPFQAAFSRLAGSGASVLCQSPGTRTDAAWADVVTTAEALLSSLASDTAVGARRDDPVRTAKDRALQRREYRPIAELLFEQVRTRA